MARRIRWFPPGIRFYEVICKCSGDEMLLRPDASAIVLLAAALARACGKHGAVRLVAFCFVSNHFHLIVMVLDGPQLSQFMQTLNQQIAQDFNRLRDRSGHFFAGRFKPLAILDEDSLLERVAYVHAQPVHHGLVERVEDWPGLSSFRAVCEGETAVKVMMSATVGAREIRIPLAPMPMWEGRSARQQRLQRRAHRRVIHEREREKALERKATETESSQPGPATLDPSRHRHTDPYSRPRGPRKRTPQPWAHGSQRDVIAYRDAYSVVRATHRVASARVRASGQLCVFPAGTFPPWIMEAPSRA